MQQKLLDGGAPYTHRRGSVSSDSDHGHTPSSSSYGGTPATKSIRYSNTFARHKALPTPPMNITPIKQENTMISYMNKAGGLDPSVLSHQVWTGEAIMMDEPINFGSEVMYTYDTFNNFDSNTMMLDPLVINLAEPMMSGRNDTNDLDFSNFINNPVGA